MYKNGIQGPIFLSEFFWEKYVAFYRKHTKNDKQMHMMMFREMQRKYLSFEYWWKNIKYGFLNIKKIV
jgi:hypothetical protein